MSNAGENRARSTASDFPADLISEVLAGRLSFDEADEVFDRLIGAVHTGEVDPHWWSVIGLSEDEASMVLLGRGFDEIARDRSSRSAREALEARE